MSFPYFAERILGLHLSRFHIEQIELVCSHKYRYFDIINPVGHGKSTIFSIAFPIWRLFVDGNIEFAQTSSSLPQSMDKLLKVQEIIETNDYLKFLIPKNKQWNQHQLKTSQGGSYYVVPFSPSARGIQPDILLLDDILRDTDMSMQEITTRFWNIFFPRVQSHKGKIIIVGTPQETGDLLLSLKENPQWCYLHKSAVIMDEKGEWLRPLWPEKFTLDDLRKIQENMGYYAFAKEYLCNPQLIGSKPFPAEVVLDCCDDNLGFSKTIDGVGVLGCDLASSEGVHADYSVYILIDIVKGEYHKITTENGVKVTRIIKDPIIIKLMERYKGVPPEVQKQKIKNIHFCFNPSIIGIDNSQWGQYLINELRQEAVPVREVDCHSKNRMELLFNLSRLFEQRRIIIPTSRNDNTFEMTQHLIKELTSFSETETRTGIKTYQADSGHDDAVFSLSMAVKFAFTQRNMLSQSIYTPESFNKIQHINPDTEEKIKDAFRNAFKRQK